MFNNANSSYLHFPQIMGYTFTTDDRMIITISLSNTNIGRGGRLLPDNFHCVFKDVYRVFIRGNPKALGVSIKCYVLTPQQNIYASGLSGLLFVIFTFYILFLLSQMEQPPQDNVFDGCV